MLPLGVSEGLPESVLVREPEEESVAVSVLDELSVKESEPDEERDDEGERNEEIETDATTEAEAVRDAGMEPEAVTDAVKVGLADFERPVVRETVGEAAVEGVRDGDVLLLPATDGVPVGDELNALVVVAETEPLLLADNVKLDERVFD